MVRKEGQIMFTRDPSTLQDSSWLLGYIVGTCSTIPSNGGDGGSGHKGAERINVF